jgi:hypothetical protein
MQKNQLQLPSITNPAMDVTIDRARTGMYALQVGSIWWDSGCCWRWGIVG